MPVAVIVSIAVAIVSIAGVVTFLLLRRRRAPTLRSDKGRDALMNDIAAWNEGTKVSAGLIFIVRNDLSVEVQMTTGKHATFAINLKVPQDAYPQSYTPPDIETWKTPLTCKHLPTLTFTLESRLDRFGEVTRLNRKFHSGDIAFDKAVHINTSASPEVVAAVCRRGEVRDAIRRLLASGFEKVVAFGAHAPVVASATRPPAVARHKERQQETLDDLALIATGLPALAPGHVTSAGSTRNVNFALLACVSTVFAIVAQVALNNAWPEFADGARSTGTWWGFVAFLASIPLVYAIVRGFSNSVVTFLISLGALVVTMPLVGGLLLSSTNALFDGSSPEIVKAEVVHSYISTGKTTNYYISVRRLDTNDQEEFSVDSSFYYCAAASRHLNLTIRAGALGWEWIDKMETPHKKSEERCVYD